MEEGEWEGCGRKGEGQMPERGRRTRPREAETPGHCDELGDDGISHLLIDDVEGQDADAVELLLSGGCTHRMEGAAKWTSNNLSRCASGSPPSQQPGDCREDRAEGIGQVHPVLLLLRQVFKHTAPVPGTFHVHVILQWDPSPYKAPSKEEICEINVGNDRNEVEDLAQEKLEETNYRYPNF